jgi:hypothetical protein
MRTAKNFLKQNWREILSRLPLPMLALAASYGVYQYALLFVPEWVAVAQAAAFEMTYLGLALKSNLSIADRKRATQLSIGAVVVSVLYNSLAGYFHRQPLGGDWYIDVVLAILHGAPLAVVAYLIADLLLHSEKKEESEQTAFSMGSLETIVGKLAEQMSELTSELTVLKNTDYSGNFAEIGEKLANIAIEQTRQNGELIQLKRAAQETQLAEASADSGGLQNLREVARQLRAQGKTNKEIAAATGKHERTIQGWLNGD